MSGAEHREPEFHPLLGRMLSPCPACGWEHYEKVHCFQVKRTSRTLG